MTAGLPTPTSARGVPSTRARASERPHGTAVPALTRPARALAVVSGVAGLVGGIALVGFFALADPWSTGGYGPWAWLGPASDVLGAVFALALVPATVELLRALGRSRAVRWWGVATVVGLVALASVSLLLVAGRADLGTQYAVSGLATTVLVVWVGIVSRRGEREGVVGWATARLGTALVVLMVVGAVLAIPAFAQRPFGSPGQVALFAPGVLAWIGLTTWPAVLALATSPTRPAGIERVTDGLVRGGYRATGGRLFARALGAPVLLLTTTSRRTGEPRTVPVVHVPVGRAFVVTARDRGRARPPAWYGDLVADPDVRVEVGREVLVARATVLAGADERRGRDLLAAASPRLALSWDRTPRHVPVVRLDPL